MSCQRCKGKKTYVKNGLNLLYLPCATCSSFNNVPHETILFDKRDQDGAEESSK
jgi:hypothetical protein